jgi:tetratricopeptide (TPR) repeat protein
VLLPGPFDANLKVSVASALHFYENTTLDVAAAELAVRTARPLLKSPELTAITAGFYLAFEGYTEYVHGRYDAALSRFAEADAAIAELGPNEVAVNVGHWRALTQRRAGFTDEAEASLRRIEDVTGSAGAGFAPREFIWACIAFDRGRHDEAVASVLKARGVTEDSGQFIGTMLVGTVSANILIGSGQHELGAEFLDRLRRQVTGPVTHHYLGAIELNAAWLAHRIGDLERRDDRLADALRLARDPLVRERLRWYPNALAELLPVAFERNVETGTAQALVRAFDIKATGSIANVGRGKSASTRWGNSRHASTTSRWNSVARRRRRPSRC